MKKLISILPIVLICFYSFGQIECFVLKSPEKFLPNVKKIAVLDFDGNEGRGKVFADYLISTLIKEDRGIKTITGFFSSKEGKTYITDVKTNLFQIVERTQLEKILNEQKLSNSGLIDDNQIAQIGKVLGIDVMITGKIKYEKTDKESKKNYDNGKVSYCLTRSVNTEVTIKLIDINTAQIVGTKTLTFTDSDNACDEKRSGIKSTEALVDNCLLACASAMTDYFAPRYEMSKFELKKIKVKEIKENASKAMDFAEKGDIANSHAIYKAIYDADNYNAFAAYNLGILNEIVGNYQDAYDFYNNAYQIENSDEDIYKAFQRAEKNLTLQKNLNTIGIIIPKHEWNQNNGDALAEKIKTTGSKSDRFEVFEQASSTSTVVAKIPGETEFTVINKEGEWYLIKLLGGKQGYINKKNIK